MQVMNEYADRLRERGRHVVILGDIAPIQHQILFVRPGLAFGIFYFMVDGEVVTTVNSELFTEARDIGNL